jgi:hypothetical protein
MRSSRSPRVFEFLSTSARKYFFRYSSGMNLGPFVICSALALGFSGSTEACKNPASPGTVADDIEVDVTAACTSITAVVQNVAVTLTCVAAEDAAALADLIAHQFSVATDAGAPKCIVVQGQTLCATPSQMVSAIQVMNARRAADGGKSK